MESVKFLSKDHKEYSSIYRIFNYGKKNEDATCIGYCKGNWKELTALNIPDVRFTAIRAGLLKNEYCELQMMSIHEIKLFMAAK